VTPRSRAMRVPFFKMHGLGNDFVVIDGRATPLALNARRWPTGAPESGATS